MTVGIKTGYKIIMTRQEIISALVAGSWERADLDAFYEALKDVARRTASVAKWQFICISFSTTPVTICPALPRKRTVSPTQRLSTVRRGFARHSETELVKCNSCQRWIVPLRTERDGQKYLVCQCGEEEEFIDTQVGKV